MESNESSFDLIERYVENKLSAEEKEVFENQLKEDQALREETSSFKTVIGGIKSSQRSALLNQIKEVDAEMPKAMKTVSLFDFSMARKESIYWIAASIVLTLCIGGYFFSNQARKSDELFAQYFSPDTLKIKRLSPEVSNQYQKGNYAAAVKALNQLHKSFDDTTNATNLFYKGNAYLALKDPEKAIECFQKVLDSPNGVYKKESEWYLALSYVKAKKFKKARPILKNIASNSSHPYQKDAEDVLLKM